MPELVIALDFPDQEPALNLARKLQGKGLWLKVGMELFTKAGPDMVRALKDMDYPVFLDLKYHDIPNTVQGAMRSAAALGVNLATIHICGGEKMVKAALQGASEGRLPGEKKLLVLGVTVLTSLGSEDLCTELSVFSEDWPAKEGLPSCPDPAKVALNRAVAAKTWGLRGIVCSPHEAAQIKKICGADYVCLTPGIRLPGGDTQDQKRVMTPAQAVSMGADFLVVGRAITAAPNPLQAVDAVFANILQGC